MKRLLWGIILVILGITWTLLLLSAAFTQPTDLLTTLIILVLFVPTGIALVYKGITKIIYYRQVKSPVIPVFNDDTILAKWEISGREWERFKERKCTSEAINRASAFYALFFGVGVGGFSMIVFRSEPIETLLSIGALFAFIGAAVSFYFIRKTEFNKYGFANDLKTGVLTLTHEFADFCGSIIPLNTNNRQVIKVQIIEKMGITTLFFRVKKYDWFDINYLFYEFPVPDGNLDDARKLIDEKRFDPNYVSEKDAMKTADEFQKRFPRFFKKSKQL